MATRKEDNLDAAELDSIQLELQVASCNKREKGRLHSWPDNINDLGEGERFANARVGVTLSSGPFAPKGPIGLVRWLAWTEDES